MHFKPFLVLGVLVLSQEMVVAEPVQLPDINTEEGVLARVFIAENLTPFDHKNYDEAAVLNCMKAQRAVLQNRLAHLDRDPVQFGARGAKNLTDIVLAASPQAISGFTRENGKVKLSKAVQERIDVVIKEANTGKPGKFVKFVSNAIAVAGTDAPDTFKDLTKIGNIQVYPGAYFWRTEGHAGPGGSAVEIPNSHGGLIAHNRFYTISH